MVCVYDRRAKTCHVFELMLTAINMYTETQQPHVNPLFLEGQPGHEKTFIVDTIWCTLRARRIIMLVVGSSALAVTLYEGGRTAHNVFQIPITEVCLCSHCHLPTMPFTSQHCANRTMLQWSPPFNRSSSVQNSSKWPASSHGMSFQWQT